MSAPKRVCIGRGLLAGTQLPLPADASEYFHQIDVRVACSRVQCETCGCAVRAFSGFRLREWPRSKAEYSALYSETDPASSQAFTTANAGDRFRVYACKCDYHETSGILELVDSDQDTWECGGHPEPAEGQAPAHDKGDAVATEKSDDTASGYTDPETAKELLERYDANERDFREAMLVGFDLSGTSLREVNFGAADLSGAKLIGTDLSWTNFRGALLIGADLTDANLSGCDLHDADFTDAELSGAQLHGVYRPDLEERAKKKPASE